MVIEVRIMIVSGEEVRVMTEKKKKKKRKPRETFGLLAIFYFLEY